MIAAYIGDLKPGNSLRDHDGGGAGDIPARRHLGGWPDGGGGVGGGGDGDPAVGQAGPASLGRADRISGTHGRPEAAVDLRRHAARVAEPDRSLGHVNPYELWWMVVTAGLSFCGYVAVRLIGPERGVMLTGLLGGLTSSTAATLNFARLSAPSVGAGAAAGRGGGGGLRHDAAAHPAGGRCPRPAAVANRAVGRGGGGDLSGRRPAVASTDWGQVECERAYRQPFRVLARGAGRLLTAIMLLARLVPSWVGEQLLRSRGNRRSWRSRRPISLPMARYGGASVSVQGAAVAIAIAAFANTLVKAGLAFIVGHRGMAWRLAAVPPRRRRRRRYSCGRGLPPPPPEAGGGRVKRLPAGQGDRTGPGPSRDRDSRWWPAAKAINSRRRRNRAPAPSSFGLRRPADDRTVTAA